MRNRVIILHGTLISDVDYSEKNDEHPTEDVNVRTEGTRCSSPQREGLLNVAVNHNDDNISVL